MAREGVTQESLSNILDCIDSQNSFLLEAGAGSGKTWTLIESLKYILSKKIDFLESKNKHIVCITYTNVAKNEISERIDKNPLVLVLTIHDFLWSVISNYQMELKQILIENNALAAKPIEDLGAVLKNRKIEYSPYGKNLLRGQITHDDVIAAATIIFGQYPKIAKIVSDKYPYIFVDEYQDTEPQTVSLLLENLLRLQLGKMTLGLFGDSMQKIYTKGVGRVDSDLLTKITKVENFRCSLQVIGLLNKIRAELKQIPAGKNLDGEIQFFHCNNCLTKSDNYEKVKQYLETKKGWNFSTKTKILQLTHKGIAKRLGYEKLLGVYGNLSSFGRDRLMDKDEAFSDFFLSKVEPLAYYYSIKDYSSFLKLLFTDGRQLRNTSDKQVIKEIMEGLEKVRNSGTVKDVYEYVLDKKLLIKPSKIEELEYVINKTSLEESEEKKKTFYHALMNLSYKEIIGINNFIDDSTPFSTKHGVKGAEYDDVVIIIDDGSWNQFNFNNVFSSDKSNLGRYDRTLNLLYVCCSRAKNKLAVITLSRIDLKALSNIENWFEKDKVFDVASL